MISAAIAREIRLHWKPRKKNSHKGNFGKILVLAGSKGLTGAAHLTALSALKTGAGLVTLGVPETVYTVLARREAEVMVRAFPASKQGGFSRKAVQPCLKFLKTQNVLALGPGISRIPETSAWAREVLKKNRLPAVVDADGINALKDHGSVLKYALNRWVLTPHPAEFFRAFGVRVSNREADRKLKAVTAAKKSGAVIVLKGGKTVVADPSGKVYVNQTGNPGMAKGGSGDVLTGMIAALLAQGFSRWQAARFGVFLHGLAGDLAVRKTGEAGMLAGDLIDFIPQAIKKTRGV